MSSFTQIIPAGSLPVVSPADTDHVIITQSALPGQPTKRVPVTDFATTEALSSTEEGKGADMVAFIQSGIGATEQTIKDELRRTIRPEHFGAVGDGVTDDSVSIQKALDYAASIATAQRPVRVVLSATYRVSPQVYHASPDWRHCLLVSDNVHIEGPGGLIYDIVFVNRSVVFLVRGDNVTVSGLRFYNESTSTSPFSVEVGAGDTYDGGIDSAREYRNLRVQNCEFINCWLGVSVQFSSTTGFTCSWNGVRTVNCYAEGKSGQTTGGNFNYRSEPEHRIKNADMSGLRAYRGLTAAAFNYYGVMGGCLSDCTAIENGYAGAETENACEHITINNLRAIDCECGLWIDDSSFITADGLSVRMPAGTNRNALFITRGGTPTNSGYVTGNITVSNFTSQRGRIRIEPFSPNNGAFGPITVNDAVLSLDGINQTTGVFWASNTTDFAFNNVRVYGASSVAFTGTTNTPGRVSLNGCISRKVGAEASNGVTINGTGIVAVGGSDFHTITAYPSIVVEAAGNLVSGAFRNENIFGVRRIQGSGSPEGVVTSGLGSTYHRTDVGQLWVKATGAGNTGWTQLT